MNRRKLVAAIVAAATLSLGACSSGGASAPVTFATPTAFSALTPTNAASYLEARLETSDFVLLDVRTPEETSTAVIEGATVGFDFYAPDFVDRISALDRDVEYVVYCNSGNRSGQTLELMRQLGFTQATHVYGGIVGWEEAGLPVVTP